MPRPHPTHPFRCALLVALLAGAALGATACSDDASGGATDTGLTDRDAGDAAGDVPDLDGADGAPDAGDDLGDVTADAGGPPSSLRFDLAAALADDFFAFPWPSDLRRNEAGGPDLTSFPTWRGFSTLLERAVALVEGGGPGFSPLSAAYFAFEVALDPETLPADVDATLEDGATVYLLDVSPASPAYGERHAATVVYNDAGGGYWPAHTLAIQPPFGLPLRPATTYAAVVTGAVRAADGTALQPPPALRDLAATLAGPGPAPALDESFRPLYDALLAGDVDPATVVAATVFTTSDPAAELVAIRDWMAIELAAPEVQSLALVDDRAGYDVYEGTFDSVELFSGEAPYRNFGDGLIALDASGAPLAVTEVALVFTLSVPDGEPPAEGWPIVLYGHGLGEDHSGFLRTAAAGLAARDVAVLGLDPPLQGDRNPTTQSDQDLIVGLAVSNIVAGREILRQGVVDEMRAAALVEAGLSVPAEVAPGGAAIAFDAARVAFMGHSEGAQIGALLAPLEPTLGAFALSAGGGGGAITMLELETAGINVAEVVATAVGIEPAVETFDLHHPATTVVIQPLLDPADPLHVARRIFREPPAGALPHDLVMMEAFNDLLTPPASTEALASAAGLPIAEPVGRPIPELDLQGIESVALPASANLPEVVGRRATGALLQFPDQDHYIIYFNAAVRAQLFDFLASSLAGETELGPTPE